MSDTRLEPGFTGFSLSCMFKLECEQNVILNSVPESVLLLLIKKENYFLESNL